jgi:hypothetical protein
VKKKAAYIFLAIYLIGATELHQLLKMPLLLEHYKEHKLDNGNLSLISFIYQHYVGDDGNANDDQKDQNLPFKSAHFQMQNTVVFSVFKYELPKIMVTQKQAGWPVMQSYSLSTIALDALFRPPKV